MIRHYVRIFLGKNEHFILRWLEDIFFQLMTLTSQFEFSLDILTLSLSFLFSVLTNKITKSETDLMAMKASPFSDGGIRANCKN